MTFKEELLQATSESVVTQDDWDELFNNRCKKAAEKGKNYEIFSIYETFKDEYFSEERLLDFAKRHNLIAEKKGTNDRGTIIVISWHKNES